MSTAIVWGVEASPFLLKLEAMLRFADRPFRRLPAEGGWAESWRTFLRLQRAIRGRRVMRYPTMEHGLDEYPGVPFFSDDGRRFQYDSSAIGRWLDEHERDDTPALFPVDPPLDFVAHLIDEAFDEFGLYMVHHMRWAGSASDTTMGERTAQELAGWLTPIGAVVVRKNLPRRQVRRCPYLFSVAPEGYAAPVEAARVPPSRAGFPPTHDLLYSAWRAHLAGMESLLVEQPYLLGDRFSMADASAYGQLSMNLIDVSAAREIRECAPRTYAWLESIRDGGHVGSRGELRLERALGPLLEMIMKTFVPLMEQNERAWRAACTRGETLFNERAFDRDRALYDGVLLGSPFRAVVKTFQVRVWRELRAHWEALDDADRATLASFLPGHERFVDPSLSASVDGAPSR